jgi:hypothetical protein
VDLIWKIQNNRLKLKVLNAHGNQKMAKDGIKVCLWN